MTQARSEGITGHDEPAAAARDAAARVAALGLLALTLVLAVGLDLFTKQLALTNLSDGHTVKILGGLVYFDLTRNSGAAFSIGEDFTFIFPLVALVVLGAIVWFARQLRSLPWAVALGLIAGGAVGNFIDRMFRAPGPLEGHVVDFISAFGPGGQRFPIFNAADSALFCGVVLVIILEFLGRRRDGTRAATEVSEHAVTEKAGTPGGTDRDGT